jgi:putative hydrolase of the HAD superfamily
VAVRAVVFDWGGTLTPWHDVDLTAQWYAYAQVYDPAEAASLARRLRDREEQLWQQQRASAGAVSTGALDSLFLAEGIDINDARHLRALGHYLDFWLPHTYADPEALDLLRGLKDRSCLVGVLSNTMWPRSYHQEVFARDDLDAFIDVAVYSSELSVAKPHASAFGVVLQALAVRPEEAVFVGDRLWDDIQGAREAGMRTIWIPHSTIPGREVPEARPDATAQRLQEILGIVERWGQLP